MVFAAEKKTPESAQQRLGMTSPPSFFKDRYSLLLCWHKVLKQRGIAAHPPYLQAWLADASLAPPEFHTFLHGPVRQGTDGHKREKQREQEEVPNPPTFPSKQSVAAALGRGSVLGWGLPWGRPVSCPCPFQPCCWAHGITAVKAGWRTRSPALAALFFTGIFSPSPTSHSPLK